MKVLISGFISATEAAHEGRKCFTAGVGLFHKATVRSATSKTLPESRDDGDYLDEQLDF